MVTTPVVTPVTIPVAPVIVATAGLLLDHAPPILALVYVVVWPTQAFAGPVIGDAVAEIIDTTIVL